MMKVTVLCFFVLVLVAVVYSQNTDILPGGEIPSDFPAEVPRRRPCQGKGQGFFRRFYNGDRGGFGGRVPSDGTISPTDLDTVSRYLNRRYNTYGRRGNGYGRFGGPNNDVPDRGDVEFV